MRRFFKVKIWLRYVDKRVGLPQKPQEPRLFGPKPATSARERPAVSSFRRRRRLRRRRPSPISRSPLRPNQRLPEPSRPTHPNSATPGRLRPSAASTGGAATTENGREAAERDRKSAGSVLPREAAHRRQQGRSTRRSGPARPIPGRAGAVPLARSACVQPAPSQMRVGERGAGGLGADWAAGAMGSRAECAAGRPLRAGEGKRGRADGRRRAG
eukprot:COSAG04_NODE_2359_length_4275_cov_28.443008_4_plen_213_part_01